MGEDLADAIGEHVSEPGLRFAVAEITHGPGSGRLMEADVALAVTGVGGPGPQEGKPVGTVWIGSCGPEGSRSRFLQLDGDPPAILKKACDEALRFLEGYLSNSSRDGPP